MSLRNRSSKNNDSFDLDSYLEEKSTEGFTQEPPSPPKEKKPKRQENQVRRPHEKVREGFGTLVKHFSNHDEEEIGDRYN